LNPIEVTQHITDSYLRYLATAFSITDQELNKQLQEELTVRERFVKGPYLDITPPFKIGKNLSQLIDEGLLTKSFKKLGSTIDLERPLYRHQEESLRKVIGGGRNLIVATGTGSGKTETFLYPILNELLQEYEQGKLTPGVRALLLYPMNALANDQMKRLRRLLKDTPFITFGRYTGETRPDPDDAERHFREHFPKEPRIENELLSREEMRQQPPHILLTNYAMLEFLLMRPADCIFFDSPWGKTWKFIVLDEAHTYSGAKGMEMAMLLRRLKDRVVDGQKNVLHCIATSATLGKSRKDFPLVAEFGKSLFGEEFEWVEGNTGRQDVVEAAKIEDLKGENSWGKPDPDFYLVLLKLLKESYTSKDLTKIAVKYSIPATVIDNALSVSNNGQDTGRMLYELLKGDKNLFSIRTALKNKPASLLSVARQVFQTPVVQGDKAEIIDERLAQQYLVALVDLAVMAKPGENDQPLLPARYHLFAKALEGAFVSLWPSKKLFLKKRRHVIHDGQAVPVFELGTCKRCGQEYIVGRINEENKLVQPEGANETEEVDYFFIQQGEEELVDNEDEQIMSSVLEDENRAEQYELCAACGDIRRKGSLESCNCEVPAKNRKFTLHKLVIPRGRKQQKCFSCGSYGEALILRFLTGQDAPTSVLASALYQKIPPVSSKESQLQVQLDNDFWENDFLDDFTEEVAATREEHGRKLLAFSDSRQDAAFFACYLNRTYQQILWRRLIVKVLQQRKLDAYRIDDIVRYLVKEAEQAGLYTEQQSNSQKQYQAYLWTMSELLAMDKGHSLEGLGLVKFKVVKPKNWKPVPYFKKLNIDEDDIWKLYEAMLNSFRRQGVLHFPDEVSPEDNHFAPRNKKLYFRGEGSSPEQCVLAWVPAAGKYNSRADYVTKVLTKLGFSPKEAGEQAIKVLKGLWDLFTSKSPTWRPYFRVVSLPETGPIYQMDYRMWEAVPTDSGDKWYRCNLCGTVTPTSLMGVCPKYRCPGELKEVDLEQELSNNHYRYLYSYSEPIPMSVEEHTAQLTSEAAAHLQEKFSDGSVNVLSCSTTFEMGVDVGELEVVFMRNVPPETSNYVQRAGRAGRRTDSTAFALTFAQRRPHDLNYFAEPERMIAGVINPPYFEMTNEKIIKRHINAVALAGFFREYKDFYGNVDDFFRPEESVGGVEKFKEFIEKKPSRVLQSLKSIVPGKIAARMQLEKWGWVNDLLAEEKGTLVRAGLEVAEDIKELRKEKRKRDEEDKSSDYLLRIIKTIKARSVLNYLSSRNVLPKYGFPVDVVELKVNHHGAEAARLSLERDLKIAISEYAPGCQVVAGGRLWTSSFIKRVPRLGWDEYFYSVCKECGRYHSSRTFDNVPDTCQSCKEPLTKPILFIVPVFGFTTGREKPGLPSEKRPDRTFASRVYFAEYYNDLEESHHVRADEIKEGKYTFKYCNLEWRYSPFGKLAVVNRGGKMGGFKVCRICGYTEPVVAKAAKKKSHNTPSGDKCNGVLTYCHLGHEFMSDTLELRFDGYYSADEDLWPSLLYAVLEGASQALSIARADIDGCLYYYGSRGTNPALVLFDNVPGGAGHVKRLGPNMEKVLVAARERVDGKCGCGEETSCYGCLRNFRNQFFHDNLKRGLAKKFIEDILS